MLQTKDIKALADEVCIALTDKESEFITKKVNSLLCDAYMMNRIDTEAVKPTESLNEFYDENKFTEEELRIFTKSEK